MYTKERSNSIKHPCGKNLSMQLREIPTNIIYDNDVIVFDLLEKNDCGI